MKVTTFATWASMDAFIAGAPADRELYFEYTGPIGKLDRAAQGQAKQALGEAKTTAGQLGAAGSTELGAVTPFYQREMQAQHAYDPTAINELLTAAEAPTGAAQGAAETELERQSAASGNAAGIAKTEQQMARDRMKAAAQTSEGIAAQDVTGAAQLRQAGAAGMSGLYGENLKGQLEAMGQESKDIGAEVEAGKSGWLQNLEGVVGTLGGAAKGATAGPMASVGKYI